MGLFDKLKDKVNEAVNDFKEGWENEGKAPEAPKTEKKDPLNQDLSAAFADQGLKVASKSEIREQTKKYGMLLGEVENGINVAIHNHEGYYLYVDTPEGTHQVGDSSLSGSYHPGTKFYIDNNGSPGMFLYEVTPESEGQTVYLGKMKGVA